MTEELCFGQRYDNELGVLEPWYVNACVDRIKQMDLSNKSVVEYGSGFSTLWWAKKCKSFASVDHNLDWTNKVNSLLYDNGHAQNVRFIDTHEGDNTGKQIGYIEFFMGMKPDIVIVDGIHRYECAEYAVNVLKPEILIIDNHQQDYVFMCPKLDELLEGVRMERFIQYDHTDHSGNPWASAMFFLNEKV